MQAVILAAGKSERFYPLTGFFHKSLVVLGNKTLLEHTITSLMTSGITDICLVVAKNSIIPQMQLEKKFPKLSFRFVEQEKTLGMGHALLSAVDYLQETFLLLSAYHFDIDTVYADLYKKQTDPDTVVLLAKEDNKLERYGVIKTNGSVVTSLTEHPQTSNEIGLRVIGIYLLNKKFLQTLKATPLEHYHFEKALDTYAKKGKVTFVKTNKTTMTLKYVWDLLDVKNYFLHSMKSSIDKSSHIAKSAILEGNIVIGKNTTIKEGVYIKGPCFLGDNVFIGNNAIIRDGVVAQNDVVIGATMEIKNSILMEHATTHTGFIGDSIIGPFSRLAAGFCSANVRFDRGVVFATIRNQKVPTYKTHMGCFLGEHVDTGTNVSLMPGMVVGNSAIIGPSTIVEENIPEDTLVYTKFEKIVKSVR